MKKYISLLIIALILAGCVKTEDEDTVDNGAIPSALVAKSDLTYLGAFRLPEGVSETKTWEWGGTSMTYFPEGDSIGPDDGYPGSLFGAGHAWEHQISEISIPVPVISLEKNVKAEVISWLLK